MLLMQRFPMTVEILFVLLLLLLNTFILKYSDFKPVLTMKTKSTNYLLDIILKLDWEKCYKEKVAKCK